MTHRLRRAMAPLLFLFVLGFLVSGLVPDNSREQAQVARAQPGDAVFVWFNFVKPDRVEDYEKFVFEIFLPALEQTAEDDAERMAQLKQTRLLRPVREGTDGVLTYVWLMDPVVPERSYNFGPVLRAVYSEEEANEFLEFFSETEAKPQVMYRTTQTNW